MYLTLQTDEKHSENPHAEGHFDQLSGIIRVLISLLLSLKLILKAQIFSVSTIRK